MSRESKDSNGGKTKQLNKRDVLQHVHPSLSDHSKSININLAAGSPVESTQHVRVLDEGPGASDGKQDAQEQAVDGARLPTFAKPADAKAPSFSFRNSKDPQQSKKPEVQHATLGASQPQTTAVQDPAEQEDFLNMS